MGPTQVQISRPFALYCKGIEISTVDTCEQVNGRLKTMPSHRSVKTVWHLRAVMRTGETERRQKFRFNDISLFRGQKRGLVIYNSAFSPYLRICLPFLILILA